MRFGIAFLAVSLSLLAQKDVAFSDDFNSDQVDLSRWIPHDPWASAITPRVAAMSGGELHLKAGQVMTTFGLFAQTYGRFEIRFRLPDSAGEAHLQLLPAQLGTLPMVDVMRIENGRVFFGNRWGDTRTERSFGDSFDLAAGAHTVALEWSPDKMRWLLDGKAKIESIDGVPGQPMFLHLEGAMDVDYVRVLAPRVTAPKLN